jgi:hypothetical protein
MPPGLESKTLFLIEVIVLHLEHVQPSVINLLLCKSSLNWHVEYVSGIYGYINVHVREYNLKVFLSQVLNAPQSVSITA